MNFEQLPPSSRLRRAALILGAWTVYGLLIGQQTLLQVRLRGETRSLPSIFASPLAGAWMWALLTPLVVAAARRLRRVRARGGAGWVAYFAAHGALALVFMAAGTWVWALVKPYVDGVVTPWATVFAYSIIVDTASYVTIVLLTEATTFAAEYRERDREAASLARTAADLQGRLDEARLHTLEAQLRPHFLYNTLNLIAELVHAEPEVADEMLTRLGLLLRRSYEAAEHVVPLGAELEFVLAYAGILARRYRDRVALHVDVPEALHDLPVAVFSLQPLVENAFRHGVERRESRSAVAIRGVVRDGALVLEVTDRALGSVRQVTPRRRWPTGDEGGHGVGLRNTRERLRALYGSRAGLTLDRRPGETTATLWLPADEAALRDEPFRETAEERRA